jgi:hypothetical protein
MTTEQGDLTLLQDPIAERLLNEQTVMRLAYTWTDGTPRVVPHWFHWNGRKIVLASPADAPKVRVLQSRANVAVTIDTVEFPPRVLLIRGEATVEIVDGVPAEYAETARRYFGEQQGETWVNQMGSLCPQMARITIQPTWVGLLDFESRFPIAIARAISNAQGDSSPS